MIIKLCEKVFEKILMIFQKTFFNGSFFLFAAKYNIDKSFSGKENKRSG